MQTYTEVIRKWTTETVAAIKTEAIRLCSGPILKVSSGGLIGSFFTMVSADGHMGWVWNTSPYMATHEYKGLGGKKTAPKGKPFKIEKRGVYSPRSQKGVIYRTVINPKKGKFSRPVAPMWNATKNAVRGPAGERRRQDLGYGIGWVIVTRWIRMMHQRGTNVTVRVV